MNYTGRPSISGCRPVLSLYPTHRFCQYLLLIFITFTNSFLFNRAFSTNSRRALSHAAGVTVPGCALSGASRQLSQRESLWRVGQASTRRAKHNVPETGVLRCLGQRQLDKVRCPEAAVPVSKARPFAPRRAFSVQRKVTRPANGSPSGGAGGRKPD